MMFIVRSGDAVPALPGVAVKASRRTPPTVSGVGDKTDYFCVGEPADIAALRDAGWDVVELRDGWYAGDNNGGGVGISGQGRYWEIRDTPFTVREASGPGSATAPGDTAGDLVNVRRAIFGV